MTKASRRMQCKFISSRRKSEWKRMQKHETEKNCLFLRFLNGGERKSEGEIEAQASSKTTEMTLCRQAKQDRQAQDQMNNYLIIVILKQISCQVICVEALFVATASVSVLLSVSSFLYMVHMCIGSVYTTYSLCLCIYELIYSLCTCC